MELCRSTKISLRTCVRPLWWTTRGVVQVRPAEITSIEMRSLVRSRTRITLSLSLLQNHGREPPVREQTYNLRHAPCGNVRDWPNPFRAFASASRCGYRWCAWTDSSGIPALGAVRLAKSHAPHFAPGTSGF